VNGPPAPTLDELAADPTRVAMLAPAAATDALVKLAALQGLLLARVLASGRSDADAGDKAVDDHLLTIPEAAKRLGVAPAFAYELARRGELPTVRVGVKYVRVSSAVLAEWITKHTQMQVDGSIYRRYSNAYDGRRPAPAPTTAPTHSEEARGAGRRRAEHRRSVGT
jgi:excisionase family DNA binding protein